MSDIYITKEWVPYIYFLLLSKRSILYLIREEIFLNIFQDAEAFASILQENFGETILCYW